MKRSLAAAFLLVHAVGSAWGQTIVQAPASNFKKQANVRYAVHDRVSLYGDLYRPTTGGPHPALLFIHGGGFLGGSKAAYATSWGPYLAARGIAVFSINYRLSMPWRPTWPQAFLDCKAALQYLRGNAAALGIDPERIGVSGDSAGGALAALLGVTQDLPQFASRYPKDRYASVSTKVKVAVPVYGVHDMPAWEKYDASISDDRPMLDRYFGGPPENMPGAYTEASPISYVRQGARSPGNGATPNAATQTAWFVSWGEVDRVVPAEGQSVAFADALRNAGANVTTLPVPGVGHWWFASSILTGKEGTPSCPAPTPEKYECSGATPNDYIAAKLLEFLARNL